MGDPLVAVEILFTYLSMLTLLVHSDTEWRQRGTYNVICARRINKKLNTL